MSLDWDVSKCRDHGELIQAGESWDITNSLIWQTLTIGLGRITEKNAEEFFRRVALKETALGPALQYSDPDAPGGVRSRYITQEDVRRRVGLYTNVGDKTEKAFDRFLCKILLHRLRREARRRIEKED